jgi:hypothetical protein
MHKFTRYSVAALIALIFLFFFGVAVRAGTTAPIYGSVFYDFDRDGVRQDSEPGVPGMLIKIIPVAQSSNSYTGATNDDGYYSVMVPIPDVYDVYVEHDTGDFSSSALIRRNVDMTQPGAGNGYKIDVPMPARRAYLPMIRSNQ